MKPFPPLILAFLILSVPCCRLYAADDSSPQLEARSNDAVMSLAQESPGRWLTREDQRQAAEEPFRRWGAGSLHLRRVLGRTLLFSSGLIVVSLLVVALGGKNRSKPTRRQTDPAAQMNLLGTLTLAPRCYLQLVSINEQHFLIARDGTTVRCMNPVGSFVDSFDPLAESGVGLGNPLNGDGPQEEHRVAPVASVARNKRSLGDVEWPSFQLGDARTHLAETGIEVNRRGRDGLARASGVGLSLEESGASAAILGRNLSAERSDPWQGNHPSQR